jgi:hypothetical protein
MEILPVGVDMFDADGKADRWTEVTKLIFAFRNSANAPKNFLFLLGFDPQFLGCCNSAASSDICSNLSSGFLSYFSQLSQWSKHSAMKSVKPFEVKHQAH